MITFGMVNHTWETLMMGIWSYTINRTLMVLTNERLLLIHTDTKANPESYINAIPLDHIKKIRASLLGGLNIKTGKKTLYLTGVPRADAKAMAPPAADGIFSEARCMALNHQGNIGLRGNPSRAASARTWSLVRWPIGNIVRASASWPSMCTT